MQPITNFYLQKVIDETTTPGTTYICSSAPGALRGENRWQVQAIDSTGSSTYANGDAGFNFSPNLVSTYTYISLDVIPPTLVSAVRDTNTQITVTLSENILLGTNLIDGGFYVAHIVYPDTTYAVSDIKIGILPNTVILTVADVSASFLTGLQINYLRFPIGIGLGAVGTISDLAGNYMVEDIMFGIQIPAWDIGPTLVSAERLANTTVRVTISELCDVTSITKANDGGFVVYETGTPGTTYAVSAISPNGGNYGQIDLTVADMIASAAVGVTITYVAGVNGTVADTLLNPMLTDATGVNAAAWA